MRKTLRKRWKTLTAVIFLIAFVLALCPATALAVPAGDFDVTGGTLGTDFTYASGVLTFVNPGDYTVSMLTPGATTTDRIYVNATSPSSTKITLRGVKIDVSGISGACAFYIESFSTVELAIDGLAGSELRSAPGQPGIRASSGVSLTITGASTLTVRGGNSLAGAGSGAGIGGGMNEGGGGININMGGNLTVYGGDLGAGIGGGVNGSSGTVRVYNGMVLTYGGAYGAGIGGGSGGNGGVVAISGGSVSANGIICGAGIGGGNGGSGGTITISGGDIMAAGGPGGTGEGGAAGIGGGAGGDSGTITISGGTVTASGDEDPGGNGGAGIGGGNSGDAQSIAISGGTVTATGGANAAGVGAGRFGSTGDVYVGSAGTLLSVYAGTAAPGAFIEGSPFSTPTLYGDSRAYFHSEVLIPGFTVTGGTIGTDYTYDYNGGILTITSGTSMTVSMTIPGSTTDETIAVASGVSADITLSGVSIDVSGTSGACALRIADGSTGSVNLTLAGDNTLISGANCAGLQKNGSGAGVGTLTIAGSGTLTATGGSRGAGIGGGSGGSARNITIAGGALTAAGASGGAGIGGGNAGSASYISVTGGTLTATGTSGGAGVGRGAGGSGSNISIAPAAALQIRVFAGTSAGTAAELAGSPFLLTTAYTGTHAYFHSAAESAPDLVVTGGVRGTNYTYAGGVLTFTTGGTYTVSMATPGSTTDDTIAIAAGINANITLNGVSINVSATDNACAFKIADSSAGNVNLTLAGDNILRSGDYCAGLEKNGDNTGVGTLAIGGTGSLTASGGNAAAGIGGGYGHDAGYITITRGTINASNSSGGAGIGGGYDGDGTHITITGGTVNAIVDYQGAGIGGGIGRDGSYITISGGTVNAQGGYGGAGIGGGSRQATTEPYIVGSGDHITISGGTVTAISRPFLDPGYAGAGIGGGGDNFANGSASDITISGGTVTATGGNGGLAIGGGNTIPGTNIMIAPPAWYSIAVNVGAAAPGAPLAGSPFTAAAAYTGTDHYLNSVGTVTETPVTGMPETYEMYTGGRVTWDPQPDGGTWDWDASYLSATFNSPATFTALRAGTTTVTYTAGGSQSVVVTILDSGLPSTGQDDTIIFVLGGAALVLLAGALLLSARLKRER